METRDAYNMWAKTYDTVVNNTRDLEANAIQQVLTDPFFGEVLEIGCGTGKNTAWLSAKSEHLTAVDFSDEMLQIARQKVTGRNVAFQQADITKPWKFAKVRLVTCSLVLEHINDILFVFRQAASTLSTGGQFYICELHPYKQLQGSRAKFEENGNVRQLEYFIHHISDYLQFAKQAGFVCDDLREWFDTGNRTQLPRLVSFLFRLT